MSNLSVSLLLADRFREQIQNIVDMPDTTVDLLFRFLRQNDGRLSRRARGNEFAQLTDSETASAGQAYAEAFGADDGRQDDAPATRQ